MSPTERRVAGVMSRHGLQLAVDEISSSTAMAQDARIDGIDVDDFVDDLEKEFGAVVFDIPWLRFSDQRASFRGCGCLAVPFWFLGRLIVAPLRGDKILPRIDSTSLPRLTVADIAKAIDEGRWIERDGD